MAGAHTSVAEQQQVGAGSSDGGRVLYLQPHRTAPKRRAKSREKARAAPTLTDVQLISPRVAPALPNVLTDVPPAAYHLPHQ